ncbi:MAG: ABC-type antimicrobial peptide transport system, ATPase component [Herbinix sp.]|jgi:putative ABC transport system ATP-binding protein|nr:ABC-type antimicrobial peptide transport system, ATPase component [Herbinix sp.]
MEPIILTKGVKQEFVQSDGAIFTALKNIELEIYDKQLTILKGRSGSGKTTLLNILGALATPSAGEIKFQGIPTISLEEKKRAILRRKNFGFVFQSVALIPMMDAYENVEYALRMANYQGNYRDRAEECLRKVGLSGRMRHMPQEMSGGEQQRVGIARAMAHHPKVIFADEPTGALDTNTGLQVMNLLKEMTNSEGVAIIMTTHDPGIMKMGDRGYELEDGEIIGNW